MYGVFFLQNLPGRLNDVTLGFSKYLGILMKLKVTPDS